MDNYRQEERGFLPAFLIPKLNGGELLLKTKKDIHYWMSWFSFSGFLSGFFLT